ncbi:MAG TPA: hypothetical protein VH796_08755 [Nitrososphaeraceae archaeon]|jgi:hypothetical protein
MIVSVSRDVLGANETYGIPRSVIDKKTVTLGETYTVINLSTWNAWHNPS